MQCDELLRLRIGKRIEQHPIYDREERRVRANAERQRHDCYGSESRMLPQHAKAIAHIAPESLQPESAPLLAAAFFHTLDGAQLQHSAPSRFWRAHPSGDV